MLFALLVLTFTLSSAEPDAIYARFENILEKHVSPKGLVDYSGLTEKDMEIKGLVTGLAEFDHTLFQEDSEREAFWINTYNILVIESILDNYPIKASRMKSFMYPENSVRHISNVFARPNFPYQGDTLSLDDIEHNILRSEFKDPRIHFALVCGAVDCPPLRMSAYRSDRDSSPTSATSALTAIQSCFRRYSRGLAVTLLTSQQRRTSPA